MPRHPKSDVSAPAEMSVRAELQQLWAEGIKSGPGRFDGMDAIKAEARRRPGGIPPLPE
jgi:hypothetical protein